MPSLYSLDFLGALFSFTSTYFFAREKVLAWPFGLMAASINLSLYLQKGIYADSCLEGFYIVLYIYGWYQWLYGNHNGSSLTISQTSPSLALRLILIGVVINVVLYYSLSHLTNSTVPFIDATTTVVCLIAQWMTGKKYIESWFLWLASDAMYLWLYWYKGIPFHVALMVIYFGMGFYGFYNWYKIMNSCSNGALEHL